MAFFLPHLACRRVLGSVFPNSRNVIAQQFSSKFISTATPTHGHASLNSLLSAIRRTTQSNVVALKGRRISFVVKSATVVTGVGLGLSNLQKAPIQCDAPPSKGVDPIYPADRPPPPTSSVSFYELGFGTVTGICAGVFVKKGAKAIAWFLGGVFFLLQYLRSASLVQVNWGRMSSKFEDLFHAKDASGTLKPPTVVSLWHWLIDFLTADFQPRASFVAGFALGLRIG